MEWDDSTPFIRDVEKDKYYRAVNRHECRDAAPEKDFNDSKQTIVGAIRSSCRSCQAKSEIAQSTKTQIKFMSNSPRATRCICELTYRECRLRGKNCATCRVVCAVSSGQTVGDRGWSENRIFGARGHANYCAKRLKEETCKSRRK